jgi:hypothetical protein
MNDMIENHYLSNIFGYVLFIYDNKLTSFLLQTTLLIIIFTETKILILIYDLFMIFYTYI